MNDATAIVEPVCAACGAAVGPTDICLACLLRAGLDVVDTSSDETWFGEFEIERRADGSLSELGAARWA